MDRGAASCWGIRTLGELAALPDLGVAGRLGEDGLRLLRLARGENQRPLVAAEAPTVYEESIEIEHPLELLEPLLFLLARNFKLTHYRNCPEFRSRALIHLLSKGLEGPGWTPSGLRLRARNPSDG